MKRKVRMFLSLLKTLHGYDFSLYFPHELIHGKLLKIEYPKRYKRRHFSLSCWSVVELREGTFFNLTI